MESQSFRASQITLLEGIRFLIRSNRVGVRFAFSNSGTCIWVHFETGKVTDNVEEVVFLEHEELTVG